MAEDHRAPEAGQLPKAWNRNRIETESRQRASAAKSEFRSWTVQKEMRGVVGRVSAGAAGKILDSANPKEIRA